MLWDQHMHCNFSGDSTASPESMIDKAIELGLSGVCFTDHLDFDYREEPGLFDLELDKYYDSIQKLKQQYSDRIKIHYGIELGLQPHVVKENLAVTDKYPFDFVIGSSHVFHHIDPYYPEYYKGKTEDEAYLEYFESILENLNTDVDFDVYGHIDYVVRYGPNKNKFYSYKKFADIIDEILKKIICTGHGIEINTAGFKYGLGHPNPTEDIIKRYSELGGEIITIGSDGHKPEHLAYDFNKIPALLNSCGFDYYTVFEDRKPVNISFHI